MLPGFCVTLNELRLIRAGDAILCLNVLVSKRSIKIEVIRRASMRKMHAWCSVENLANNKCSISDHCS